MARDLRLFYLFRLLATSYLWVPIFVPFMLSRGLDFREIMLLGAIYSGVVIVVEIPTGALADRIGRKHSMMAGALAMIASCLVSYQASGFPHFVLAEVLAAVSMSLCSGADSAYLFDLLQENGCGHEYGRREGTATAWHQIGSGLAFAAGGLLGTVDLALPYLVTAAVAGLAFLVAAFMRPERKIAVVFDRSPKPVGAAFRSYIRHMRESLMDVRGNRRLAWLIAYSAVVFVLLRATVYLYQPYLNARQFSTAEIGLIFAVVYLLASFVAHRADALRRWLGDDVLIWGLLGTLAVTFVILNQLSAEWALCILGVQAVANGMYSPLVKPLLNREIPDSTRRATVLSVESIARRAAMGIFSPIAGIYGAVSAIYLCGVIGFIGIAVLAVFVVHAPSTRGASAID